MNLFLSKYINNIDKKGRVSVPANLRSVINVGKYNGIIAYKSIRNNCIEACDISRIEEISNIIDSLDPYSEERDAFETVILAASVQIPFDSEGRIYLPKDLLEYAGIAEQVCFVGKGKVFEIWNNEKFEQYEIKAKEIATQKKLLLKKGDM